MPDDVFEPNRCAPLRGRGSRLYPVGRLDKDSEGLLLLTDDGDWTQRLLHPRYEVEREYAVGLRHPLSAGQSRALSEGIELDEGGHAIQPAPGHPSGRPGSTAPSRFVAWYRTARAGWRRHAAHVRGRGRPWAPSGISIGSLRPGGGAWYCSLTAAERPPGDRSAAAARQRRRVATRPELRA
jgi:hypothetical protein